jgi:phosphoribosylformylglycinamidine (FGAM) synthase PurS component
MTNLNDQHQALADRRAQIVSGSKMGVKDPDAPAVQAEMRGVGYQINPIPEGSLNYIRKQAIDLHDRTTKRDRKRGEK